MIVVKLLTTKNGSLVGFDIQGHSESASFGNDIICASVSSAAYMTANTITDIIGISANIDIDDGKMTFEIEEKDSTFCRDIILGFKLHMVALEEQYPENINVNYTEV